MQLTVVSMQSCNMLYMNVLYSCAAPQSTTNPQIWRSGESSLNSAIFSRSTAAQQSQ